MQGVPVLRRGNEHGIDVGAAQQVAEVVVVGTTLERAVGDRAGVGLLDDRLEGFSFLLDRVAGGDDLGLGHAQQQRGVLAGTIPRADHAQRNACARRRVAVFAQRRSRHNRRRRHNGHARDLEKRRRVSRRIHESPRSVS